MGAVVEFTYVAPKESKLRKQAKEAEEAAAAAAEAAAKPAEAEVQMNFTV